MARRRLGFAWVAFALGLALASCVSPEELRREDEATCTGYGFHPDTDAFASCLQKESLARRYPPYWGWGYWSGGWGPYWPWREVLTRRPLAPEYPRWGARARPRVPRARRACRGAMGSWPASLSSSCVIWRGSRPTGYFPRSSSPGFKGRAWGLVWAPLAPTARGHPSELSRSSGCQPARASI
jgi:hypothetical protein